MNSSKAAWIPITKSEIPSFTDAEVGVLVPSDPEGGPKIVTGFEKSELEKGLETFEQAADHR